MRHPREICLALAAVAATGAGATEEARADVLVRGRGPVVVVAPLPPTPAADVLVVRPVTCTIRVEHVRVAGHLVVRRTKLCR